MGGMRIYLPRTFLGKQQHGTTLLRMHRQTVHTVLQKTQKIIKFLNKRKDLVTAVMPLQGLFLLFILRSMTQKTTRF